MSDQRYYQSFKSSQEGGSNSNKVSPRVPVNRPVPRSNFNRAEREVNTGGYGGGTTQTQQTYEAPRSIPSMNTVEQEFVEEKAKKKGMSTFKKVLIGFLAVVILLGIFLGGAYLSSTGNMPFTNGNSIFSGSSQSDKPSLFSTKTSTKFDGQPVPVKWPTDVKPTRMEMQLDPNTGELILLLVGEKDGVGTVIRSYDKNGNLIGYWIITPDETSANTSNNTNTNQQQNQQQSTNQQQSDASAEQEIAVATHKLIGNHLEGKNADQILQEFGPQLAEIGKKYNLNAEQVLQVYIKVAQEYQQQQQSTNQQQQQSNNQQQTTEQTQQQQGNQQNGN